jgi:hypothetical protein
MARIQSIGCRGRQEMKRQSSTGKKRISKPKLNPTSRQLPGALGVLQILLKEVLEQTSPATAELLVTTIKKGGTINLHIGENSSGRFRKCACQWGVDEMDWRFETLPESTGNA